MEEIEVNIQFVLGQPLARLRVIYGEEQTEEEHKAENPLCMINTSSSFFSSVCYGFISELISSYY